MIPVISDYTNRHISARVDRVQRELPGAANEAPGNQINNHSLLSQYFILCSPSSLTKSHK